MNHPLSHSDLTLCRACSRLISIRTEGFDEMEGVDRHFDGGEWSGPAWANIWQEAEEGAYEVVASRYGLTPSYVMHCMSIYQEEGAAYEYRSYQSNDGELPTESTHTSMCEEYWERGLDCRCIPEEVKDAIRNGARPEEVM